jgi:hypothetical protein
MHHPDTLPQRDPRRQPTRNHGPVDCFSHSEVVAAGDVLNEVHPIVGSSSALLHASMNASGG